MIESEVIGVKKQGQGFVLELKKPEGFEFKAGQFVMIHCGGVDRPFSIASFPSEENLKFLIRYHEEGEITPRLVKLEKGEKVKIEGPLGTFGIKGDAKEIFFVAVGTGVAPFRSMIGDFLEKNSESKLILFFGFRDDCFFEEDFNELAKKYDNFKVVYCSSSSGDAEFKGRVTEHFDEVIGKPDGKEIYLCGMKEMVEDSKKILENLGFNEKEIHVEKW